MALRSIGWNRLPKRSTEVEAAIAANVRAVDDRVDNTDRLVCAQGAVCDAPSVLNAPIKETALPHIIVKLASGRSQQQKERIAAEVTKAIMSTAEVGEGAVSVSIEDYASSDWTEQVYKPEIIGKPDTLFKKPGYGPR
jgi:4-oxalocrotonate tautomerase